jgi:hypothetical protein
MRTQTPFCPETDTFAFDNSWPVDGLELEEIRRYLAEEHAGLVRAVARSRLAHLLVRYVRRHHGIDDLMRDEHLTRYGLCGGMAFTALDYYTLGWVVPQGAGPDDHPAPNDDAGGRLRSYIWRRLLDSMQSRAARTMLLWSLAIHLIPRLGEPWVLARSKQEWAALKRRLDAGRPWPIGLVGRAGGSIANHQVLALGYDDPGDGSGTIVVYDSCCPRSAHTITLDFRGRSLSADETCACTGTETRWKGFFCAVYTPARPPVAVGLTAGVSASPGNGPSEAATTMVQYTARNNSFSRCPPLALRIGLAPAAGAGTAINGGGEERPQPLDAGASRTLTWAAPPEGTADAARYSARCFLGVVDGAEIWKELPVVEGTTP